MSTKAIIGVVAIGGVFLLVVFFGFGKDGAEVVSVAENNTEVSTTSEVLLPLDMPTSVPMYPGSVVRSVQDTTGDDGVRNITLSLGTNDSVSDVNTWYRGALKINGWAVVSDRNVGGYSLLKGENENIATFTQAANNSSVGMVVITQRIQIK